MKQVNFTHEGGFPLEQETLERLQTAYRSELYEALKRHFSIDLNNDYIVAHATNEQKGWAVIRQEDPANPGNQVGVLYPIVSGTQMGCLKTTRTDKNLIYGTGASQTAYHDYEAEYSQYKYADEILVSENGDVQTIRYYDLRSFEIITDIKTIDEILQEVRSNIGTIQNNINVIEGNINAIEGNIDVIEGNVGTIQNNITTIQGNINAIEGNIDAIEGDVTNINGYLAKALVDTSTPGTTNLSLNYQSNWTNTHVGGKIYLDNTSISTENYMIADKSSDSLLITDSANQVFKSNNLLDSLLKRITKLETQPATAIPYGIVAIWGKPEPIPEGWEEYLPLKGKMPVGHQTFTGEEKSDALDGDGGNGFSYYRDYYNTPVFPFETLGSEGGRMSKNITINELPPHYHHKPDSPFKSFAAGSGDYKNNSSTGTSTDGGDNTQMAIGNLGESYKANGDALERTIGDGKSFAFLNPYRVVQFIVYTGRPRDKTAPTAPTLIAPAQSIGTTSVYLSWSGATDEFGVTEYVLFGNAISPISVGNTFNRTIYGLTPGTPYTFYVVAKDAAGNTSLSSNVVQVTTSTIVPPTTPQNITSYLQDANEIYLQWDNSTNNNGAAIYYEIWRRISGGAYLQIPGLISTNYYTDSDLEYSTTYSYYIVARDAVNNTSGGSDVVSQTTLTAPGGGGGGGCFDIESLVTMASGQSKKLKNIEIGDKLQGFSFPNEIDESDGDYMVWNGKLNEGVKAEVTVVGKKASLQPNYFEIKTAETTIKATGQHPLLVTEDGENVKWVCVKNVSQDMSLIDKTGKTKAIESIIFKEEPLDVILLDVEDVDNYVISGIVAHNNKQPIEQQ
ncbi:intein [Flavobacterium sp. 90]|uniref:hypothetical protein n=1 Tax=unclassified Flavobacterium TaxID=196869 RepID=UPI000EAD8084|nr:MULTISPECIES: hypothetical protein [unclassified Flavobacterium]RKR11586.1 intein [Flavobacterium sp. 81]TCK55367.1 intein [Flavobacterium sp. 90]